MEALEARADTIRARVFGLLGCDYQGKVAVSSGEGLTVDWDGGDARIAAEDQTALCRGFFLLGQAVKAGERALHVSQRRHIASCGAFIECSRGGVMTVAACKKYIDCLAALGLNLFSLYMEDVYTVPEYPYFGHLRGRYTPEELKEIDAYAQAAGVEFVPAIQTLAHLGQFLQWHDDEHLKDTDYCLLIDEEETYAFIEDEIRAIRGSVSGTRLNIGMDEAHGVGLGRYFDKHGLVNRFELLNRHLRRVTEICEKYGFHPMMWSDMFFRLGSKTGDYYDMDSHVPQSVIDNLPNVDMIYWDYYHTDEAVYEHMITEHQRMGRETVFAGGIWTWSGFLPRVKFNNDSMYPALRACARHHVNTAMATMWGDDGNETNLFLALSQLPIFSEYCWLGDGCTPEIVARMGESLTGLAPEVYNAFGLFYPQDKDDRTGKGLIYCDLLYPLLPGQPNLEAIIPRYERAREIIARQAERPECRYADAVFAVAIARARAIVAIRAAYDAGDREALRRIAREDIPAMEALYRTLEKVHRAQWMETYKRNGWELFPLRYGAVCNRMRDAALALEEYADGKIDAISELDEPRLDATRRSGMQWYDIYTNPKR